MIEHVLKSNGVDLGVYFKRFSMFWSNKFRTNPTWTLQKCLICIYIFFAAAAPWTLLFFEKSKPKLLKCRYVWENRSRHPLHAVGQEAQPLRNKWATSPTQAVKLHRVTEAQRLVPSHCFNLSLHSLHPLSSLLLFPFALQRWCTSLCVLSPLWIPAFPLCTLNT